jgi:hypothetical protein
MPDMQEKYCTGSNLSQLLDCQVTGRRYGYDDTTGNTDANYFKYRKVSVRNVVRVPRFELGDEEFRAPKSDIFLALAKLVSAL